MYTTTQGLCFYFWSPPSSRLFEDSISLYITLSPFLSISFSITHTHIITYHQWETQSHLYLLRRPEGKLRVEKTADAVDGDGGVDGADPIAGVVEVGVVYPE